MQVKFLLFGTELLEHDVINERTLTVTATGRWSLNIANSRQGLSLSLVNLNTRCSTTIKYLTQTLWLGLDNATKLRAAP